MKAKTLKRILAVLTTACIISAAIPAVQTYKLTQDNYVSAAEAVTLSSDVIHIPEELLKENGYIFGLRKEVIDDESRYFLYYQDATERDEDGQPTGAIIDIKEFDGSLMPKPDYKTMNNLSGDDATEDSPATGEKLEMEELVAQALEDYFLNEETGCWSNAAEKQDKVAVPRVEINGQTVNEPGIIVEPEIPAAKPLKENTAFMEALIKMYDAEEGHQDEYSFKNDYSLYDEETKEITDAGYEELYRIFSNDLALSTSKATDVKKLYTAVVSCTQARELNRLNRDINDSDIVDLEKAKWVLETKEDLESTKKVYAKTSSSAKFWVSKNGDPTSGTYAADASGSSVVVSKTAANGKYNNEVVIKAVSKDYSPATAKLATNKGTVYTSCTFYVVPPKSSSYKASTLKAEKKVNGISFANVEGDIYTLSLNEGKSFKLPFALENGRDKSLVYESSGSGFIVRNGIVKALGTGSGIIKVYPADCYNKSDMTLTVNVTVSSALRSIRSNTNTVCIYPGSSQTISLGTVPPSYGKYTYAVHGLDPAYTAAVSGDKLTISSDGINAIPKLNRIAVTIVQNGKNMEGIKNLYITIKGVPFPQNITKIREANNKVGSDGTVEINMLKGTACNLGVSAYPVTCEATLIPKVGVGINSDGTLNEGFVPITAETYDEFIALYGTGGEKQDKSAVSYIHTAMDRYYSRSVSDDDPTAVGRPSEEDTEVYQEWLTFYKNAVALYNSTKKAAQTDTSAMKVSGDVISCKKAGTYYLQFTSAAKNSSDESITSNIYKINVYEAGGSIVMNDMRDTLYYDSNGDKKLTNADTPMSTDKTYDIVCGQLMTSRSADTDTSRVFSGGTTINVAEPYCLGSPDEEIEWKCSKAGAVKITKGSDYTTIENGKIKTHSTLDLKLCQAGVLDQSGQPIPFTITGTSKQTKQKFSFKISVDNDTDLSQALSDTEAELEFTDSSGNAISQPKKVNAGDTFNVYCSSGTEGVAGRVKYTSSNKKVLSVSSSGQVKAVSAGSAVITAVMTINDKKTTTLKASANITVSK